MDNKRIIQEMLRAIENREEQERRLAADYIELNPSDEKRRTRDKQLILYAFMLARLDVQEIAKKAGVGV